MEFSLLTPEHAYLYGFLLTDGHHQGSMVSIEINERDSPILKIFQDIVNDSSIYHRERLTNFGFNSSSRWSTCNKIFRELLISYGFPVGKKSESLTMARWV